MKNVTICWARNEADILEAFVRHHARFSSMMLITLHRTVDNSHDILMRLQKEGISIEIRTDERPLHEQSDVMSGLLNEAFGRHGADWVLPLDADEFLCGDVVNVLRSADQMTPLRVPWRGYVPTKDDPINESNVLKRITHRRSSEQPVWYKTLAPRGAVRGAMSLSFGNHDLLCDGKRIESVPAPLFIAHFPVRSIAQIERKIRNGYMSRILDPKRPKGAAFQLLAMHERLKSGPLSADDLTRLAMNYATERQWNELPASVTDGKPLRWRHSDTRTDEPVLLIDDPVPCDVAVP